MAREILFRGFRKWECDWVEGYLLDDEHIGRGNDVHPVYPETVGQFAGKTDKNGNRIFEGDIAKYTNKDGTSVFYEVVWDNEFSALMFRLIGGWSGVFMAGMSERVEVIGNIHDNPELLNGTES